MKNATPRQIAWISILVISGFISLILLLIKFFLPELIDWLLVILIPIVLFVTGFFVFSISMENFIYRRIKLIYKTIYDTKLPEEKKPLKPRKYCRYGFSRISSTVSSSVSFFICLIIIAPMAARGLIATRPIFIDIFLA